jgi:hypothetical protein
VKTSDIPDEPILKFLAGPYEDWPVAGWATWFEGLPNSVQNAMPAGTPKKVALSKMASLIRRGKVEGCACGCRGDFRLPNN